MKEANHIPRTSWRTYLAMMGPGIAIAATGVGAGDMVSAAVSGGRYGFAVVWAAAVGALLKFILTEGVARWQLATGTTLLEGWARRLGKWVQYYFLIYLILWSFVVGGGLISACGLAAHAMAPGLSVEAWGAIHSLVSAAIVLVGRYEHFERLMQVLTGVMFVTLLGCALWVSPPTTTLAQSITMASLPSGSSRFILSVIGGVGGTLTLLSYGYWMRERNWEGPQWTSVVRFDLIVAYVLTGIFAVSVMVLAANVLHTQGVSIKGEDGVLKMAAMLGNVIGPVGHWAFLMGFWGAVVTSVLGVWQGVPYLFCDFVGMMKGLPPEQHEALVSTRSPWYRGYLLWLAVPPMVLLFFEPVGLIVLYSIIGALFMPFLAGTLLYMNSRREWVGDKLHNNWMTIALLALTLVLFAYLCADEVVTALRKL